MTSLNDLIRKGGFTQRQSKVLAALGGGGGVGSDPVGAKSTSVGSTGAFLIPAASTTVFADFSGLFEAVPGTPPLVVDLSQGSIYYPEVNKLYLVTAQINLSPNDVADEGKTVVALMLGANQTVKQDMKVIANEANTVVQLLDYTDDLTTGMDVGFKANDVPSGMFGQVHISIREL